jgi:hypothetical protein
MQESVGVITEFRSIKKDLILKDYINYHPMNEEHF